MLNLLEKTYFLQVSEESEYFTLHSWEPEARDSTFSASSQKKSRLKALKRQRAHEAKNSLFSFPLKE